ncbi:MAG: heat-inducible transcriptional repressor HrcA [Alphaproteobacteria bacterium]|nr:heat-inducible transcriptional repressor HrcA [Alphaproteobacteria bacterium]
MTSAPTRPASGIASPTQPSTFAAMDQRSRDIFREVVQSYLDTGEPVGSRTISRRGVSLSPASIRNVMSDLAELGLLDAPHVSSGRIPTHAGLRMFVDSLLQIGEPADADKRAIEGRLAGSSGKRLEAVLADASELLSGLVGGAGLVTTPTHDGPVRHVEFVRISSEQALAVIVAETGDVENRLLSLPPGLPASALVEAGNYLNARMKGRTLSEAREAVTLEIRSRRAALDEATSQLVEEGLAQWSGEDPGRGRSLIVRGRANLLDETGEPQSLDRVRDLFAELERSENLLNILDTARLAEGVRLFIGSENPLFSLSGSAMIVAPYINAERKIVGALGVIGPTRLNYARVIPMVDYTAQVVGRLVGDPSRKGTGSSIRE